MLSINSIPILRSPEEGHVFLTERRTIPPATASDTQHNNVPEEAPSIRRSRPPRINPLADGPVHPFLSMTIVSLVITVHPLLTRTDASSSQEWFRIVDAKRAALRDERANSGNAIYDPDGHKRSAGPYWHGGERGGPRTVKLCRTLRSRRKSNSKQGAASPQRRFLVSRSGTDRKYLPREYHG